MSETNERSVASAGSVAGDLRNGAPSGCGTVRYDRGPVAWAVMPRNSDYCVTLSTRREAAQKAAERKVEVGEYATMDDIAVVPLYRQPQPTLTDAERRALEVVIESASTPDVHYLTPAAPSVKDILRGLLERLR